MNLSDHFEPPIKAHLQGQKLRIFWGKIRRARIEDLAAASTVASGLTLIFAYEFGLVTQREAVGAFAFGICLTVLWLALYLLVSVVSDITRKRK